MKKSLAFLAVLLLLSAFTYAQPGMVLSHQKISQDSGSFSFTLDADDNLGTGVADLGDVDGDGVPDIAIGAWQDDDGGNDAGAVYVCLMNANGTVKGYTRIANNEGGFPTGILDATDFFGIDVYGMGDFNRDGWNDIVVGASGDDDGGSAHGACYLLFLDSLGVVQSHQKISDTQGNFGGILASGDAFGVAVASLADMDGDGNRELVAGASGTASQGGL